MLVLILFILFYYFYTCYQIVIFGDTYTTLIFSDYEQNYCFRMFTPYKLDRKRVYIFMIKMQFAMLFYQIYISEQMFYCFVNWFYNIAKLFRFW